MNKNDLNIFINDNISSFHDSRILSLKKLKLEQVLKRKNPYLFKAKNVQTSGELVKTLVDAFLSSQEETLFGEFLEKLAIHVCNLTLGGFKSGIEGIDLEFDKNNIRYIISIKSGPNWGNSSQIKKMKDCFKTAKKTLRTQNSSMQIVCVNGCCYGIDNQPDKGDYFKYCGQRFWQFISGEEDFYLKIIEPLGYKAKQRNDDFYLEYSKVLNQFTREFSIDYCDNDGAINWEKIVKLNSQKKA